MGAEPDGEAMLAERSSMPAGVGGDTDDAGDVEMECDASGVSGVPGDVGGVRYIFSGCGAGGTSVWGGGRRGVVFGGEDDGPRPVTNDGALAPWMYGVVEGTGDGDGEGKA